MHVDTRRRKLAMVSVSKACLAIVVTAGCANPSTSAGPPKAPNAPEVRKITGSAESKPNNRARDLVSSIFSGQRDHNPTMAVTSKESARSDPRPDQGPALGKYQLRADSSPIGHFQLLPKGKYRVSSQNADEKGEVKYHSEGEYRFTSLDDDPSMKKGYLGRSEHVIGRVEFLSGWLKDQQQTNVAFAPNAITGRCRRTEWHDDNGRRRRIHRIDFSSLITGEYLEYRDSPKQ